MKDKINKKAAARQANRHMLETGHCAQATLYSMHNLIGFDGFKELLLSAAGLAGGIGHQGAVCGTLVSGALVLGLESAEPGDGDEEAAARSSMFVSDFVRKFNADVGKTLCEDITEVDFADDWQVRKYTATGALKCLKLTSEGASMIVDILNQKGRSPDNEYFILNRGFSDKGFNCAHSTIRMAFEKMGLNLEIPKNALIPLNGGIGYSGSTCTALVGGCMAIGLLRGGDNSEGGILANLRRQAKTLTQGSSAFKNLELSPTADALVRCSELFTWFEERFSSHLCRKITDIDFHHQLQAQKYFSEDSLTKCISIAEETAAKTQELI